jgi:hypothetical protein
MPVETLQLWLRITARCSGSVFMFAFGAAGWAALAPALRALAARRRAFIVGFGALHTIHVGFVISLGFAMGAAAFWKQFNYGLIGGGILVLMMWGLVADALAPGRWPLFAARAWRGITEWAFFAIFALAFTGHARDDLRFLPLALLALAGLVGRIAWYVSLRRHRAATATA